VYSDKVTGTIRYAEEAGTFTDAKDSESGCKKASDETGKIKCVGPTRSEISYNLKPVGLTYQQLSNWMKLEQLVIGPFSDE
jgi:hypothetical protein